MLARSAGGGRHFAARLRHACIVTRCIPIQFVKQPSVFILAAKFSARAFPLLFPFPSSKEEAERRNGACFVWRAPSGARTGPAKTGLALRRSTAVLKTVGHSASAPCQGYYPLALARRREGQVIRSPLVGWGAFSTRLPGHGLRGHGRGHRFPLTFGRLGTFLRRAGTEGV